MTRYFFAPETGNDSNNGLSTGAPKKTTSAATALVLAGNQISFKCGEKINAGLGSAGWSLNSKILASECLIDFWNDDVSPHKPMIDAMTYLVEGVDDANWTSMGDGRWQRVFTAEVNRMFQGSTEAGIRIGNIGSPFGYVASPANVDNVNSWHTTTSAPFTVTLYTGSLSIRPPTFFDGLACVGAGKATAEVFKLSRCSNIHIRGWQLWGGRGQGFCAIAESGVPFSNLTWEDCEANATGRSGNGFLATNTTVAQDCTNIQLIRCTANNRSTAQEDDDTSSRWGSNNGINMSGRINGAQIVDCIMRGGYRHSFFQAQGDGTTTRYVSQNIQMYTTSLNAGYIDCIDSEYGHGIDSDSINFLYKDMEIRNQAARSQFAGVGVAENLYFKNPRQPTTSGQNGAAGQCAWIQNWSSPDYRKVVDVTLLRCRFDESYHAPVHSFEDRSAAGVSAEAGWSNNAVKIRECVFKELAGQPGRTFTVKHEVQGSPFLNSGFILTDNIFITAKASPIQSETSSGVHTNYDINAYPGASGNVRYASLEEAGLDADLNVIPPPPPIPEIIGFGRGTLGRRR